MTLNLMFRYPDLYHVGVAGAPVADQALCDSIYQGATWACPRITPGLPRRVAYQLRRRAQRQAAILHGTGDDNMNFQGTQRLLNPLIALNKQAHFMEYPNRRHGVQGSDTVRLDTLRYGFFEEYLPVGPR